MRTRIDPFFIFLMTVLCMMLPDALVYTAQPSTPLNRTPLRRRINKHSPFSVKGSTTAPRRP
jgi:hypothetical protein